MNPIDILPPLRSGRKLALTFVGALSLGVAIAATAAVLAQDGEEKREPVRDNPLPVQAFDLPDGEHLTQLAAPRLYGSVLIFPPGQAPDVVVSADATAGWTYTKHYGIGAATKAGLVVSEDAVPPGYVVTNGSALEAHRPDGTSEFTEAGLSITGAGYPIGVVRAIPFQHYAGEPYAVPAWLEGNVMTTLGTVRGTPAVFVHKRPGVRTEELQQVFVGDGSRVILVEGYVDDFRKLIRVAESVLANVDSGGQNAP